MRASLPWLLLGLLTVMPAQAAGDPAGDPSGDPAADLRLLHRGIPHDAAFDISMDGSSGWAVGAGGLVLRSTDGGVTWQRREAPTSLALLAVAQSGETILAAGQGGLVLRHEGGTDWTESPTPSQERLFGLAIGPNGTAFAVGAFGTILRSNDEGATWTALTVDWSTITATGIEPHLYAVRLDGPRVIVVGEAGTILQSADGGVTWTSSTVGEASFFDVQILPDGHGLAVGQKGVLARTDDGGRTWSLDSVPSDALLGVWTDGVHGVAAGVRSLFTSRDGGNTWTRLTTPPATSGWYQAVEAGATGAVIVGHQGLVLALPWAETRD